MDAREIIIAFGGVRILAMRLGIAQNRVSNWTKRGFPQHVKPTIWAMAQEEGVELPEDFLMPEL